MLWASVSEKPTRASAEYLNGDFRAVSRPSSSDALPADDVEHLVAFLLHQLLRPGLQVEPEQGLGVRGPHVEVPVLGVYRDPVQVRDLALRRESLLQLLQLDGHVRNGRVQFAREEVALPVRTEDLRQRLTLARDKLEHEEEGNHP